MKSYALTLLCFLLISLIALIDYLIGYEFNFSLFYIGPIAIMAWTARKNEALTFAALAALIWLFVDLHTGHPYEHPYAAYWNTFVRLGIFIVISELLSKFKEQLDKEASNASHDLLTQLLNRSKLEELMEIEINRIKRYGGQFSVVYIDIDHFKEINDQFGHQCGDNILKKYAKLFQTNLRATDKIARIGGDEFLLLLPETNQNEADRLLIKIEDYIENNQNKEEPLMPYFSAGVFVCNKDNVHAQELINNADRLMYSAKNKKIVKKATT